MLKTPRLKTCVLAVTMAALPLFANAAGLGRLNVLSGLGQPFRGEIDLVSVQPGEADSLVVSLAPPEAFATAQISYPPSALGLRFNIEKRANGQYYVTVNSAQAITEPFLDLLVELNWASGRIQREYTALIDPVGYAPSVSSGSTAKFSPSVLPGTRTTGVIKPPSAKISKAASTQDAQAKEVVESRKESTSKEPAADSYTTKSGDTLSAVAKRVKPDGVSLDQVLVSLYRSNTDAFDGNMNRLKRGKILRVQSALEMQQLSAKEATKEVQVQSANWSEYRSKLGEAAAKSAPRDLTEQATGGKITAKVEDQGASAVDKNKDVLKLSKAADAAKKSADNSKVLALEEEVAARQKALNEANQRVAELQKNVADMEKLVAMKAKASAAVSAVASPTAVGSSTASAAEVVASAVSSEVTATASEVAASAVAASPVAKVKKRVEIVADVPEEPGFIEGLFENPLALGGGALAILLGAGGLWYARRRQRPGVFEDSIITGGDLKANTVLGSTGGGVISTQSTENSFLTDFSRQGLGTIDTDEVDPIAEAEVYMAYGRDAQAEEILKDALHKDPSRHEIRMKLLDIYAARKDKVSFEEHASALFAITGGKGHHWEHAAENGRAIDPENPLYQALDGNAGLVDTSVLAPVAAVGAAAVAASALSEVTEPDLSQALDNHLDFELDLDPSQNLSDLSGFGAESGEALEPAQELQFNEPEPLPEDANELSFDSVAMDLDNIDQPLPGVEETSSLFAAQNDQMMALDLPIDLGVPAVDSDGELEGLDALADFDLDAALNPIQETAGELASPAMNEFESMVDSLDLDISTPVDAFKQDEAESIFAELPDLNLPDNALEKGSQGDIETAAADIGLDFDFDLNEGLSSGAAAENVSPAVMDVPLGDISLGLEVAATDSELDFAADDPVQTKIDLARAYIDMGDVEGAREILQEALQEGSPEQQNTAKSLLSDL
ncbi:MULTISPECIES: FimV/HubP family polar landmark protein [Deefgea]|uniref:LysM domain-containing protein n=1 Tax=Deefgea chitinilytica TaxID=570276 RepID=A0ABS2C8B2_9NEIS|nr:MULTISPECIES: FimV/HubP family polar landmark protein [Deefgea]MBM5570378.1 hypothetical protein [Deefgea chitinilytica]MBM9887607.1 hypothetical protein [Deefgea sp. CFH1-16]